MALQPAPFAEVHVDASNVITAPIVCTCTYALCSCTACEHSCSCTYISFLCFLHRSCLLHYFCLVVVDDDLTAPGSTFNVAERDKAADDLFQYAAMVQKVSSNLCLRACTYSQ